MKLRIFIAFLLLSLTSQAQFVIRGKVVSGDNDEPLPFANVFLANTTKGATTNEKGAFVLPNLSPGRFDVVVSYVGYETLVFPIRTDSARISSYLIKLKPIANQLAEVRVKARRGEDWEQNLDFFIKNFIGQSENSRQCKLLNPDVLWFDDDRPNTVLTAGAREPLLIENNALGYRVKYQLESFVYDYGQRLISYVGYPVLEVLKPKSPRQAKRWETNRRAAYFGSTTHFMRSLHNRKLQEEGFEIRRIIERDDSVKAVAGKPPKKIRMLLTDTLTYSDFAASDTINSALTKMAFQDLLQVTYLREKEEMSFLKMQYPFGRIPRGPGPQVSIMRLVKPYILVEPNGHYYEPLGLFFEGYLTWEKVAELLPLEYEP